jgi:hypothetical protein
MKPSLRRRFQYAKEMVAANPLPVAGFAALYLLFNVATVIYIHGSLLQFYRSMYLSYTIPFTALTLLLSVTFGIAAMLFVAKLREIRLKSAGLGFTGLLFGGLAAGCPGCYFGLFPILLSLFGISATLAILPFNGLELQILGIIAMCASIITLAKGTDVVCELRRP